MAEIPRKKSPRAPSISLDEAFARVEKVYDCERLHPTPIEVVAQDLGYKSANNGAALGTLASLRYFGLLERPKEGMLAVTKDVESYKFAPDEKLRRSLLLSFLGRPTLYSELLEKYESGLPSDANLKFELIQRGFAPQVAESALVVFKRSVNFADYYGGESRDECEEDACNNAQSEFLVANNLQPAVVDKVDLTVSSPAVINQVEADDSELDRIPVRLSGGRRAWLFIPTPFYDADKARLKAQIDLLLTFEEES